MFLYFHLSPELPARVLTAFPSGLSAATFYR